MISTTPLKRLFYTLLVTTAMFTGCSYDESFSTDPSLSLEFSVDTLKLDTFFSTVPSSTKSFWVYNRRGDGIRIASVRLERGNQTGFRVNVDGYFLDPVVTDVEVHREDSVRVFVELTSHRNNDPDPQLVEDNLIFTLQNGTVHTIPVTAYSWDAQLINSLVVERDTVIESSTPIVFTGDSIRIAAGATLTVRNTTLYFHGNTGISVQGRLVAENSLFRGDRLDYMFSYLPYDRVSGQWAGIHLKEGAECEMTDSEIHSTFDGIVVDSASISLQRCVIHNNRGYGLKAINSVVELSYCQLTNTLRDCLSLEGSLAVVDHCTLAQFYPFSANRGAALRFKPSKYTLLMKFTNTLVTGYEEDVLMGAVRDSTVDYRFQNCLLRTPVVTDSIAFTDIIWETSKDSIQGKHHFRLVDEEKQNYDFRLDTASTALKRGIGCLWPDDQTP